MTQFNSFYQTLLILTAVVFSTVGVLLGLLVTGQPFGIVMSGIGVIALAGIVVNNNIVLIDTYNELRARGLDAVEAMLRTGAQRLRPVLLTAVTTVLGLMPMVLGSTSTSSRARSLSAARRPTGGSSSSTAIAGGLDLRHPADARADARLLMLGARRPAGWRPAGRARREAPSRADRRAPAPQPAE